MSLAPFSSAPGVGAAKEPPTFREARDLLLSISTTITAPGPRSSGRGRCGSTGRSTGSTRNLRPATRPKIALKVIGDRVETRTFADLEHRIVASRQRTARARGQARRPALDDARRRARTVGDDARGDETRARADPGDADARGSRHRRQAGPGQCEISDHPRVRCGEIRRARGERRASRGRRGAAGLAPLRHASRRPVSSNPTARPRPTTRCCSISPPARRRAPSSSCIRHASYPIGHLSTMYGLGLKPGDAHLNISSPGWAKHAWSSVFAPWNAGAAVIALASASSRARRSTRWSSIRSRRSAPRRPCGGC